jgi:hypothetical protein
MSKKKEREHIGWAQPSEKKLTLDTIRTIQECELYVDWVFGTVCELHGEKEARRIFAQVGNWPKKRELKLRNDAKLLLDYLNLFLDVEGKPNVSEFARQQAKKAGAAPDAMERKVWRVLGDEKLWEKLYDEGFLSCPWPLPEDRLAEIKSGRVSHSFLKLFGLVGPPEAGGPAV